MTAEALETPRANSECLKVASAYVKAGRALDDSMREVDFVCSTADVDSDDEVVEQTWDLGRFDKNPVALYSHNRYGNALPIGKWKNVRVEAGALHATLKVATAAANPLAENVWQSLKEGTLGAVSVGFRPRDVRAEKRNDKTVYVLSNNLLYEISVVPIPANENAMRVAKEAALKNAAWTVTKDSLPITGSDKQPAADSGGTEKSKMDEKQLQELQLKATKLENELAAERIKTGALNERVGVLEGELAAERKAHNELELKGVEESLNKRVGKKISPAEKPGLLRLASLDRTMFDEQLKAIDARPDSGLTSPQVPAHDPVPPTMPVKVADSGEGFEAMVPRG